MRCKNCGWENPNGSTKCEKCNASLSGAMGNGNPQHRHQMHDESAGLKKTVSEKSAFGSNWVSADPVPPKCLKCGYPVTFDTKVCPMCGTELVSSSGQSPVDPVPESKHPSGTRKCSKCSAPIFASTKFCPSCGAPVRPGTVNPWMTPQNGTFCTLKPLAWQSEGIDFNPLSYSGESIVLSRANTDPNNQSITSKEQAELVHEKGAWYIIDRSEHKTTYVHACRKTKLESGDIIILGNRRFEFKG